MAMRWKERSFCVVSLIVMLSAGFMATPIPAVKAQQSTPLVTILNRTFFFHSYSLLYDSGNQSVIVYSGADLQPPGAGGQVTLRTMSDSGQRDQLGRKAWAGAISWVTEPLAADVRIVGTITLYVWMSSSEDPGFLAGSAYGMGVGEIGPGIIRNGVLDTIWFGPYVTRQSVSKILTDSPKEYSVTITGFDHVFRKGNRIAFATGIASTKQGWSGKVYFDSPQLSSRAVLDVAMQQDSWIGDLVVNATDSVVIEGGTFTMIDGSILVYGMLTLKSLRLKFEGLGASRDFGLKTLQSGSASAEYSVIEHGIALEDRSAIHLLATSIEKAKVSGSGSLRAINSQVANVEILSGFSGGVYIATESTTEFSGKVYGIVDVDARQESAYQLLYRTTGWVDFRMNWLTSFEGQQGYYTLDGSVKARILPYVQVETQPENSGQTYVGQLVRYYQDSEVAGAGLGISSLRLYRWSSGAWVSQGTSRLDTANKFVALETNDLSGTYAAFASDVRPPSLTLQTPQKSGTQLTVVATATDNVGLAAVYLLYSAVKDGQYTNLTMTNTQATYSQTIPVGNKVYFRVVAVDVAGNKAERSSEYPSSFKLPFCWIASASYGSSTEPKLDTLRAFRDHVLKTNPLGQLFVDAYYSSAPPIAAQLEAHSFLREATRVGFVEPIYYFTELLMSTWGLIVAVPLSVIAVMSKRRGKNWMKPLFKMTAAGLTYLAVMTALVFTLGWLAPVSNALPFIAASLLPAMLPGLAASIVVLTMRRRR